MDYSFIQAARLDVQIKHLMKWKVTLLHLQPNWNKDGIQYDLLQIDGKLSAGELADMAREVINNRR